MVDETGSQDAVVPFTAAAVFQGRTVKIVQIGSVTPAEDFQELIKQGVPLEDGNSFIF